MQTPQASIHARHLSRKRAGGGILDVSEEVLHTCVQMGGELCKQSLMNHTVAAAAVQGPGAAPLPLLPCSGVHTGRSREPGQDVAARAERGCVTCTTP